MSDSNHRHRGRPRPRPPTLFGYDVVAEIGEGAGSLIYSVTDPTTGQPLALKHVVRQTDKQLRFVEQLQAEFEVASKVRHEGLRRCFALKYSRSLLFKINEAALIMELVEGRPLEWELPPTTIGIIDVFVQTAKALEGLHAMGYVHCDLKPSNILVSPTGLTKVIDLGQACKVGTAKKRIQGTPDYIAPEQVKCLPVTVKTDVFNFGATLYWSLCGRKLPTLFTLRKSDNSFLVDDVMATPHALNPLVPDTLSNLVMECVRTSPSRRPDNMGELAKRLEVIRHGIVRNEGKAQPPSAIVA
jgi:serine/threonine protein kinase